jgi:hypothetical protein
MAPSHPRRLEALVAGTALGLVTSGGIIEERLSFGSLFVGVVVNAFMTLASFMTLCLVERRARVPEAIGAVVGILLVHLALHLGWISAPPWLTERPLQLVNDGVAVFATLMLVWGCAQGFDIRLLLVALVALTLYRVTRGFWHLDMPPHGFAIPVQDLVLAQCGAVAVALLFFRFFGSLSGGEHKT